MSQSRSSSRVLKVAALSAVVMMVSGVDAQAAFDVVEKNVPQLLNAYLTGNTTVQDVVNQYLTRIQTYDDPAGKGINAVGQINPDLAAAISRAQNLISSGATTSQYPLLGVPILVKDSYDVQGMITTNGVSILNGDPSTPLSTTLIAKADAPNIAALKAAGAIILGKSNMSTMAYSTFGLDNAHGVVRNPYNYNRAPGGSSSGSATAEASNFAMLTMGGETGGSIRIPSAYNGIVGLKTSAGLVSPNGLWPLTPTRDVAGPMGKTVADMAYAMNALTKPEPSNAGNIWINTPYYPAGGPQPGAVGTGLGEGSTYVSTGTNTGTGSLGLTVTTGTRPVDYTSFLSTTALQGKTLVVPSSVVRAGDTANSAKAVEATFNTAVYDNFQAQLAILRAQGANVVTNVDIPAEVLYFNTVGKGTTTGFVDKSGAAIPYPTTTATGTTTSSTWSSNAAAYYYEKQIEGYGDTKIKNLRDFANALADGSAKGAGSPFATLASSGAAASIASLATIYEAGNAKGFGDADNDGSPDNPDAIKALAAFTTLRQQYINQWMSENGYDAIIEPSMSGVAGLQAANLRTPGNDTAVGTNGNGAHNARFLGNILGLPALSVPSGTVGGDQNLWTGLQFIGRLDSDAFLMGLGYDYEDATHYRFAPDLSAAPEPALATLIGLPVLLLRRRRRA